LKVKYADFKQHTKSKTFLEDIRDFKQLHKFTRELLNSIQYNDSSLKIRLLGLSVSNITNKSNLQIQFKLNL